MSNKKRHLTCALGTILLGTALYFSIPVGAWAADPLDPATQPHLKSWSNVISNAARRFVVLADFDNQAVLDRETGLVWEKSPATTTAQPEDVTEGQACANKTVGGRKGWRLPSFPELASLIDPNVARPGPTLPLGHPFIGVLVQQEDRYWSATKTFDGNPWVVLFDSGLVTVTGGTHAWCVRGGMNADQY